MTDIIAKVTGNEIQTPATPDVLSSIEPMNVFSWAQRIFNLSFNIASAIADGEDKKEAFREKRWGAGIVLNIPELHENREKLVDEGKIPDEYSTENIKKTLLSGSLPKGWNLEIAVNQGFGKEARRAVNIIQAANNLKQENRRIRAKQKQLQTIEAVRSTRNRILANASAQALRNSVI